MCVDHHKATKQTKKEYEVRRLRWKEKKRAL